MPFCILWDGKKLHGLNASGRAPAAWNVDYFRKKYGAEARQPPMRGWDSVTVPGAARLGFSCHSVSANCVCRSARPAIDIAERGYAVPVVVQESGRRPSRISKIFQACGSLHAAGAHRRSASASRSRARPAR